MEIHGQAWRAGDRYSHVERSCESVAPDSQGFRLQNQFVVKVSIWLTIRMDIAAVLMLQVESIRRFYNLELYITP
jgi:hypothetical protein